MLVFSFLSARSQSEEENMLTSCANTSRHLYTLSQKELHHFIFAITFVRLSFILIIFWHTCTPVNLK